MESTIKDNPDICPDKWQEEFRAHVAQLFLDLRVLVPKALEEPYGLKPVECDALHTRFHIFLLYLAVWFHDYRTEHLAGNRPMTREDVSRIVAAFHGTEADDGLLAYGVESFDMAIRISTSLRQRKEWKGRHLSTVHPASALDIALKVLDTASTFSAICTSRDALMNYLHGDFFEYEVVLPQLEADFLQYGRLICHLYARGATMYRALPRGQVEQLYRWSQSDTTPKLAARRLWWGDDDGWAGFVRLCQKAGCLEPLSDLQPGSTLMFRIPENQEGKFCVILMGHHKCLGVNLKDFAHDEKRGKGFTYNNAFLRLVAATVTCKSRSGVISATVFSRAKERYVNSYARILRKYN